MREFPTNTKAAAFRIARDFGIGPERLSADDENVLISHTAAILDVLRPYAEFRRPKLAVDAFAQEVWSHIGNLPTNTPIRDIIEGGENNAFDDWRESLTPQQKTVLGSILTPIKRAGLLDAELSLITDPDFNPETMRYRMGPARIRFFKIAIQGYEPDGLSKLRRPSRELS